MDLNRDSSLDDIFYCLENKQIITLLFVDQTEFCTNYSQQQWVKDEADIVEVDQEILDFFQIGKVPQFRFYVRGAEAAHLVGTQSREEILKIKKQVFGDLIYRNLNFGGPNGKVKKATSSSEDQGKG